MPDTIHNSFFFLTFSFNPRKSLPKEQLLFLTSVEGKCGGLVHVGLVFAQDQSVTGTGAGQQPRVHVPDSYSTWPPVPCGGTLDASELWWV